MLDQVRLGIRSNSQANKTDCRVSVSNLKLTTWKCKWWRTLLAKTYKLQVFTKERKQTIFQKYLQQTLFPSSHNLFFRNWRYVFNVISYYICVLEKLTVSSIFFSFISNKTFLRKKYIMTIIIILAKCEITLKWKTFEWLTKLSLIFLQNVKKRYFESEMK